MFGLYLFGKLVATIAYVAAGLLIGALLVALFIVEAIVRGSIAVARRVK